MKKILIYISILKEYNQNHKKHDRQNGRTGASPGV